MPKSDALEMDGTVIDTMRNSQFTVRLDNGHELLAYTGGNMRGFTSELCSATMCELNESVRPDARTCELSLSMTHPVTSRTAGL